MEFMQNGLSSNYAPNSSNGNGHLPTVSGAGSHSRRELTDRQREVFSHILEAWRGGAMPVVSHIARDMGLALNTVNVHLEAVQRKGYISIEGGTQGRQRVIKLTPFALDETKIGGIPIYGEIVGGAPAEAIQSEIVSYLETLDDLFPRRGPKDFGLSVRGDSMWPEIKPGDLALFSPDQKALSGDIVAAYVGEEYCATLKYIYFSDDGSTIQLKAANESYTDITVPASQVVVVGVLCDLIRHFR
jgi:SOS regulatory protein LexA